MLPYVLLDAIPSAVSYCDKNMRAIEKYLAEGDSVLKVVQCVQHYGVALFRSGRLVLLAPECPSKHGTIVENGDGCVVDVASGHSHIVFCNENGSVFSFGFCNKYGQLGDGTVWVSSSHTRKNYAILERIEEEAFDDDDIYPPPLSIPTKIAGFDQGDIMSEEGEIFEGKRRSVPIGAVACGANHTLLLTKRQNCIYGCGLGLEGQLGGKQSSKLQPSFKSIRLFFGLPIRQVKAAGNHSFVLLQTGKLFAFGENICGQLGIGSTKMVKTPTAVSFSSANENHGEEDEVQTRGKLDSLALRSLRAPWGTTESMHFPLRVERLSAELDSSEPFILSVWCCANRTVVLTRDLKWLSCGLPLSRSPSDAHSGAPLQRMDKYGPLGRWIDRKKGAYSFKMMRWSEKLSYYLRNMFLLLAEETNEVRGETTVRKAISSLHVVCTNHAVVALIPTLVPVKECDFLNSNRGGNGGDGGDSTDKNDHQNGMVKDSDREGFGGGAHLFVQGDRQDAFLVSDGGEVCTPLSPKLQEGLDKKLLLDHEVDDDSCEYIIPRAHTIISSNAYLAVI